MTIVAIGEADGSWDEYDRAALLIAQSYPAGSASMDAAFLRWSLEGWAPARAKGVVATAVRGGDLVGFAGASPRMFTLDGAEHAGFVVSFVAVAPAARGEGLAHRLYASLLDHLSHVGDGMVLTFAHADSAGAALIERCYPGAGWSGRELEPMSPWGALRRRIATLATETSPPVAFPRSLQVSPSAAAQRCLGEDPRVLVRADSGIRVSRLAILGGTDSVGIIDTMPATLDAAELSAALHLAGSRLPPEVTRLVVPYLPDAAAAIGAACGLRRMPGPVYRAWTWAASRDHPMLRAVRCLAPIT